MTTTETRPLVGWAAIAQVTPYAAETLRKTFRADLIAAGVVIIRLVGRPPQKRPTAYAHDLANFFSRIP